MKTFAEFMLECSQLDEGGLARAISKSTTHDSGHISADRGSDESANREKRKFGKEMRRAGRESGQETVITKKAGKPARLHDTQSKKPGASYNIGKKAKPGDHPKGDGQTGEKRTRGSKLSNPKNKDRTFHYDN